MKIEVFKSSNSEDWFWRLRRSKNSTFENDKSYASKAIARRAAIDLVLAIVRDVGIESFLVKFEAQAAVLDGEEIEEIVWSISLEALRSIER